MDTASQVRITDIANFAANGAQERLMRAVSKGDLPSLGSAIKDGADVNAVDDETGCTPLTSAVFYGQIEVIKALRAAGADIHFVDGNRQTSVTKAIANNQTRVVRALQAPIHTDGPGWQMIGVANSISPRC